MTGTINVLCYAQLCTIFRSARYEAVPGELNNFAEMVDKSKTDNNNIMKQIYIFEGLGPEKRKGGKTSMTQFLYAFACVQKFCR